MSVIFFLILIGLMLPVDFKKNMPCRPVEFKGQEPLLSSFHEMSRRGTSRHKHRHPTRRNLCYQHHWVGRGPVSKVSVGVLSILFSGKTGEGCVCEAADRRLRVFVCWHPSAPGSEV